MIIFYPLKFIIFQKEYQLFMHIMGFHFYEQAYPTFQPLIDSVIRPSLIFI